MTDPRNEYHFVDWQLEALAPDRSQATLHESLHADLNDSTAYGGLLHVVAYLARHAKTRSRYTPMLERLESRSRRTHEIFATSLSTLIRRPDLQGDALLEHYPDYRSYLQAGASLSRAFSGRFLRYHVIVSALRFCMQSRLVERVLETGLGIFETDTMRWHEAPDERLRWVQRIATPDFWRETLKIARASARRIDGWSAIEAEEAAPDEAHAALDPANDALSKHLMCVFHDALEQALGPRGISTLPYDGHVPLVPQLIEQAHKILPPTESDGRIIRAQGHETPEELQVRQFENERLILSREPYEGHLIRLDDLPDTDATTMAAGDGDDRHVFLIVRLAHRMLEQYAFSPSDTQWLEARGTSPVVAIQRSLIDSATTQRIVEHIVFENPDELSKVVNTWQPDIRRLCSFSMAAAGDAVWTAQWYEALIAHWEMVGLFDLSPFAHFNRWSVQDAFDVHIGRIDIRLGDETHFALACLPNTGRSPAFVAPCSEIVASSVIFYVREVMQHGSRFIESDVFIRDQRWALLVTLSHLLREERIFDFGAGHRLPVTAKGVGAVPHQEQASR